MNPIFAAIGEVDYSKGFRMEGYRIWGSSVVQGEDGRYHMFASRIPDTLPFHPGWMVSSEVVRASSSTPEGPYIFEEVVLPARGAQYWDGRSTHNPKIIKAGNRYALFYMGSTHPFEEVIPADHKVFGAASSKWSTVARANKRIGVALCDSVFGPWERMDFPVLQTKPNTFYSFLTSNPSPVVDDKGKVYLIFKARGYEGNTHGDMTIGLATAPDVTGPYTVVNKEPLFSTDTVGEIEDPYLWHDRDGFHLLAKDQQGSITGLEHGNGILAHSDDCLKWTLDQEPLAYSKAIKWSDGKERKIGNIERVSGLHDSDGRLSHLFFAIWEGTAGFGLDTGSATAYNMAVPLSW